MSVDNWVEGQLLSIEWWSDKTEHDHDVADGRFFEAYGIAEIDPFPSSVVPLDPCTGKLASWKDMR